ncbi:MAG: hypothetical protein A4E64_03074 [Syntrophorhabdus sp. PtaU1.Bin058]|nr:MAG: hypothetical protein A4E64_03074 [Syntrophorhabdus sp. PtaU1.Bin058]
MDQFPDLYPSSFHIHVAQACPDGDHEISRCDHIPYNPPFHNVAEGIGAVFPHDAFSAGGGEEGNGGVEADALDSRLYAVQHQGFPADQKYPFLSVEDLLELADYPGDPRGVLSHPGRPRFPGDGGLRHGACGRHIFFKQNVRYRYDNRALPSRKGRMVRLCEG